MTKSLNWPTNCTTFGKNKNDKSELDTSGGVILGVEAVERAGNGEGLEYSLASADGRNMDRQSENYDSATNIEYTLELVKDEYGVPASGVDPVTGMVALDDYEWVFGSGVNVQTVDNYTAQDRYVITSPDGRDDGKNFEKYKTTVDVDGEIVSVYDKVLEAWVPDGEITTKVFDEVIKSWYDENDEPVTLFGESVTEKTIHEGRTKVTTNLKEIKTPVIDSVTGGLDFVYSGDGTQHIDAKSTQRKATSGSAIASYNEHETEWVKRELTLEIPAESVSNEWDVVSGEGKSGGSRGWGFGYFPLAGTGPVDFYDLPQGDGTRDHVGGDVTKRGVSFGFYSDAYKGDEFYDTTWEEWKLLDGRGNGGGMTYSGLHYALTGSSQSYLILYDPLVSTFYREILHTDESYTSTKGTSVTHLITTGFSVENGVWSLAVTGKDTGIHYDRFTCDTSGPTVKFDSPTNTTHAREYYRHMNNVQTITTDWGTNMDTVRTTVTTRFDDWRWSESSSSPYSSHASSRSQTLSSQDKITEQEIEVLAGGVMTTEFVPLSVVYSGDGTASGREEASASGTSYRLHQFGGRISRDAETGVFSAESVTSTIGYGYVPAYNGTVIEHNNTLTNYLGFVIYSHTSQGGHINIGSGSAVMTPNIFVMQYRDMAFAGVVYDRPVNVFTGTFVIDGASVGAGFEVLESKEFDSGIEQFIPPGVTPQFEPYDLSSAFLPQQSILGAFGRGLWTGVKADVNGISSAVVGTATLGYWDKVEVIPVNDLDRAYGYDTAAAIANMSGNILVGVASGGAGCWAKGSSSMAAKGVGYGVKFMDIGGNAVGLAKNGYDIYDNGPSLSNIAGVAGNGLGLAGNLKMKCFTAGTQVVIGMEYDVDGNFVSYATMNIEDVNVGDLVYSYDTQTGEVGLREVTATFSNVSDHINYLTIVDEHGNEQTLETTDGHPFWVVTDNPDMSRMARDFTVENGIVLYHENMEAGPNGYWVHAKDLKVGDIFLGANGELSTLTNIVRIEQEGGIGIFNFSVEGNHNYFILAKEHENGQTCVLVHNTSPKPSTTIGETLDRIRAGQKHPHRNDGTVFKNLEGNLPARPEGFYREYVHESINIAKPGKERIVTGMNGDVSLVQKTLLKVIKCHPYRRLICNERINFTWCNNCKNKTVL